MTRLTNATRLALLLAVATPAVVAAQRSDTVVKRADTPRYKSPTLVAGWKLGTVDGAEEYQLSFIQEVLVTTSGDIWLIDVPQFGRAPEVKVFDSTGKFVRRVGRQGSGPGEFTSLNGITQLPDGRVAMRDQRQARVNVYRADGASDTTWLLMRNYSWPINGGRGVIADPRGVVWLPFSEQAGPAAPQRRMYLRLRANGSVIDTVTPPTLPAVASPPGVEVEGQGGRGYSRLGGDLYANRAMYELSPLGYFVTGVNTQYAFELHVPRADPTTWRPGDPVLSVRRPNAAPVPVNPEEQANQRAILQYRLDREVAAGGTLKSGIPPFRPTKPPYERIMAAPDGRIWVTVSMPSEKFEPPPRVAPPGAPQSTTSEPQMKWRSPLAFDVFDPDGTYLGRIAMPRDVYPVAMRGNALWAVTRDDDGVNFLTKYNILWK